MTDMDSKRYVMYILVNNDLKMDKGKIAAQVGHVIEKITEEIFTNRFLTALTLEAQQDYQHRENWKLYGRTKIVLKASQNELIELIDTEKCRYILDAGRTQVAPNSLTVVGFYPRNDLSEKMSKYKLL